MKQIDWDELCSRYREAAESSKTPEEFAKVIHGMLAELQDMHVWIKLPDGTTIYPCSSTYRANYDHRTVAGKLNHLQRFGPLGFVGRTVEGFAVIAVIGLPPGHDQLYEQLLEATAGMFDAAGFIVDLRANSGGAEPRAAQIAGLFADRDYLYARSKFRAGPNINDFREAPARHIAPAGKESFVRPVICLIGPGCVSSGEGFAMMMKAMDHVTLVGQPTRGASGNPAAVTLPNGVQVWFSRWVSMTPDGTAIEGRGVQPDLFVDHAGSGDPTFDKAVELLSKKTGVSETAND